MAASHKGGGRSRLQRELHALISAWTFFTRLPAPTNVQLADADLAQAQAQGTKYLPLIGILTGAVAAGVFYASHALLPASLAVLLSMLATVLFTGALHEDGFADTCDGFGGGWSTEQVLAIMKDSRLGSYGALGLAFMVLGKFLALSELGSDAAFGFILVAAHSVSRLAAVTVIYTQPYVQRVDASKSGSLTQRLSGGGLAVAAVSGLLGCALLAAIGSAASVLLALAAVLVVRAWLGRYFYRRLGGYTGDCLGAMQQATEATFYLALLVQL